MNKEVEKSWNNYWKMMLGGGYKMRIIREVGYEEGGEDER
jgi:hypothetical protein